MKTQMLALHLKNGESATIDKDGQNRMVISYSEARARKDNEGRERGIKKLEKQIKAQKLTKAHINNKGYNKFLR